MGGKKKKTEKENNTFGIPEGGASEDHTRLSTTMYIFQVQEAAKTTEKFRGSNLSPKSMPIIQQHHLKQLPVCIMIEYCTP